MSACTSVGSRTASSYQRSGRTKPAVCVGSGVRRGKEGDQGERTTSALVPDAEPGKRVTGFVARTTSCKKGEADTVYRSVSSHHATVAAGKLLGTESPSGAGH